MRPPIEHKNALALTDATTPRMRGALRALTPSGREGGRRTRADVLWHTSPTMTHHYGRAQIAELHAALEKIKDTGRWNKSLATLRLEQQAPKRATSPARVPQQEKTA